VSEPTHLSDPATSPGARTYGERPPSRSSAAWHVEAAPAKAAIAKIHPQPCGMAEQPTAETPYRVRIHVCSERLEPDASRTKDLKIRGRSDADSDDTAGYERMMSHRFSTRHRL
jgi:hypothetical protein